MPIGINKVARNSQISGSGGSAIPVSVVSRPDDNNSTSTTDYFEMQVTTTVEWPEFGFEISANTQNATRIRVVRLSDSTVIGETTGLFNAGNTPTVDLSEDMVPEETYGLRLDAEGASWTAGFGDWSPPITSDDGNLTFEGSDIEGASSTKALVFKRLGGVGF
jgi:hypothetical protein